MLSPVQDDCFPTIAPSSTSHMSEGCEEGKRFLLVSRNVAREQ